MRIAMVTATPRSVGQGSGTFVAFEILRHALESVGHEVIVVTPHRSPRGVPYTAHRFAFNASVGPRAVAGCDLAIGWDMDGVRLAGHPDPPFVAYVSGMIADEARYERGVVRWSMRLQAMAERASARRAARVLTTSAYLRSRITEGYGVPADAVTVVPPAFDGPRWLADFGRVPTNERGVLTVGRMYPRKDHAALVRAAALLTARGHAPDVTVVGDGPEREALTQLVRHSGLERTVRLAGQVDFPALLRHYASCAVFCLPSRQEGFGIVLLEAMAAGKPIVACRGTAAEEIVQDGVNGVLVPPGDPAALADALHRLLHDAALRRRFGAANRATAARWTAAAAAERFLAAVEPVVHRGDG